MKNLFNGIYNNKKILVTGHTGFKGSWLAFWLTKMGANVSGLALNPQTNPNHFELLKLNDVMKSHIADIRNRGDVETIIAKENPDLIFHLAAQPLVRYSYESPIETLETNIMGTANVFEAALKTTNVKAVVNVTSDKCYENKEWPWGYRENEPMGGFDPYSCSKGCSELITNSYRKSFFEKKQKLLASCRAGNVIGGGDWAMDRLVPDIVKGTSKGESTFIRNPLATRPWQHVLEPLSGYLLIGEKLLKNCNNESALYADGWNFGPMDTSSINVAEVTKYLQKYWQQIKVEFSKNPSDLHEAHLLKLDCSKADQKLHWKPVWNAEETFKYTTEWYKFFYQNNTVLTHQDLDQYICDAKKRNVIWTLN